MASEVIERSMYNGLYQVVHNPNARGSQPRYTVNNIGRPKGVTTILGQTLNKDLMQWAVDCMEEYLADKLPSVTASDLAEGKKEFIRRRDSGASTGSEAHMLVELFLKGKSLPSDVSKEAKKAYQAFVNWYDDMQPEVINVEEVIYSKALNYAGTYDAMLNVGGLVYLADLKTTNVSRRAPDGVYAENFIQLGGYYRAHEEHRNFEIAENGETNLPKVDGLMVISAKKDGKLNIVTNTDVGMSVEDCAEAFEKVHNMYEFLTRTTKLLGGR